VLAIHGRSCANDLIDRKEAAALFGMERCGLTAFGWRHAEAPTKSAVEIGQITVPRIRGDGADFSSRPAGTVSSRRACCRRCSRTKSANVRPVGSNNSPHLLRLQADAARHRADCQAGPHPSLG
jgi:hypothetical protein